MKRPHIQQMVSFRVPSGLWLAVAEAAKARGLTVTAFAQQALAAALDRDTP